MQARRTTVEVKFNGQDISEHVIDFSYTDNSDQTDDISIKLSDREMEWTNKFFPETGDTITCKIKVSDWLYENDNREINLGKFEVDNVNFDDTVTINAVSIPITSSARSEKKNTAWKKITLQKIASDIASKAKLKLIYETDVNPFYDKQDQNDKSDLEFLESLCKSDGLCMKITDGKLIVFEEMKYDQQPAVLTIERGKSNIVGKPSLKRNAKNIYSACEITYFDGKTDKNYKATFKAPNAANVGHVLKIRENFNSEKDDKNLSRKAKARLREQNKKEWTANFTMLGDIIYFAGTNINIKGWFKFDGKYHIESVSHSIGSGGYRVELTTRRCLEGY